MKAVGVILEILCLGETIAMLVPQVPLGGSSSEFLSRTFRTFFQVQTSNNIHQATLTEEQRPAGKKQTTKNYEEENKVLRMALQQAQYVRILDGLDNQRLREELEKEKKKSEMNIFGLLSPLKLLGLFIWS